MTMETRCFKVIFPKYSTKKKPAEDTLVPPLRGTPGKDVRFSRIICSRCCTRRNLRFHVENRQHADQKQLTRRYAFDLDIGATHRQPASCWARPVNVDDGLEDQGDARCREREVARGVLRSSPIPEKRPIFCHQRGMKIFCRLFSTQQRPNVNTINTVTRG